MSRRPLTPKQKQVLDTLAILGSEHAVAARLGITRSAVQRHIEHAKKKGHTRADADTAVKGGGWGLKTAVDFEPYRLKIKGDKIRMVAIGDYHDSPGQDKSRIKWIARFIESTNPDLVVQIGDYADFDSMSRHEKPGSTGYAELHPFVDDLESLEEVFYEYNKILPDGPLKHVTLGNHEERCLRFDKDTPQNTGLGFADRLEQLMSRYKWKTTAYGQWLLISHSSHPHTHLGAIHVPHTMMGREYGGKTTQTVCNDATFSMIFGHSHRSEYRKAAKIGFANSVEVLSLGTSMPQGMIKRYAGKSVTGWAYGVWLLTVFDGHIVGHQYLSMDELQDRFGD